MENIREKFRSNWWSAIYVIFIAGGEMEIKKLQRKIYRWEDIILFF